MEEPSSPSEQDILVSRLIARISELEERLYKRELESPAVPSAAAAKDEGSNQQSRAERPKEGQGLLAAFKDSWRTPLAAPPAPSSTSDWFFSVSKQPAAAAAVGPSSTSLQRLSTQPQPAHADTDDDEADGPGPSALHGSRAAGSPSFHAGCASSRSDSFVSQARYGTEPGSTAGSTGGAPQPPPPSTSEPPRALSQDYGGSGEFEIMPTLVLQTPLIINGVVRGHGGGGVAAAAVSAATPPAPPSGRSVAQDWLSSLFAARRQPAPSQAPLPQQHQQGQRQARLAASSSSSYEAFNEKAFQASLEERGRAIEADAAMGDASGSYYRYVFDPMDVQAEMEVTARVRKAAAEALMEAEEKLRAAEEAQAGLRQQLGQAMQLQEEVERLKRENEAALQVKKQLEDQMIGEGKKLESMEQASQSLQQELEGLREQREIWKGEQDGEQEKLKAENALLRRQLQTRLNDLQLTKNKLSEAEAEKQRLQRDVDDQAAKLQWLQRINGQLESSAEQLEHYKKAAAAFQERFIRERNVRRKLHDQLQVLKGNIRVMCRVRPALPEQQDIITYPLEGLLCISPPDRREQEFEFDHVFAPESTQEAVYEEVSSLVRSCADGYNVCIFAYGQTGSGKTFTMEGPADNPGIYVRALQELFAIASEENSTSGSAAGSPRAASSGDGVAAGGSSRWRVSVAMIEIYNESVHDLLRSSSEVVKPLEVSGLGPAEMPPGMDRVQGLTWRPVSTIAHVQQVLREGSGNRATASTALNAHSSRSHALLSVRIEFVAADGKPCSSSLHLVDLAGSERVDKSEVTGQNLKEAQSINKSLSALGDVVSALQRRNSHIPFRNSKLTQVLQDSLCGSSKVLLVCNISPEAASASETLSSLNFASRAAQVELGQARKAGTDRSTAPSSSPVMITKAVPHQMGGLKQVRSSSSLSK